MRRKKEEEEEERRREIERQMYFWVLGVIGRGNEVCSRYMINVH